MRIIHVADTHLGYKNFSGKLDPVRNLNQRECDVYDAWHAAVDVAIEREPDLFIHSGDLFDSSRPSPRAIVEALSGFGRLRDAGIPALVIAGNHSTPRFRSGGSVFEILHEFRLNAIWGEPETVRINGLAVHCVPHEPQAEKLLADIRGLPLDSSADANLLVLHAGLEGVRQDYHEVNEIALAPEELAKGEYAYIALGHLHKFHAPQLNAVYAGSLERLDFGDIEGEKAVVEIDLEAGAGSANFLLRHAIPTRPMLDIGLPCEGVGPGEVVQCLEQAIDGLALDGAVLRLRFESIQRDVYHSLDLSAIDELLAPCLQVVRSIGRSGLVTSSDADDGDISFAAFARREMPKGVDAEAVVRLALGYLDDAAAVEAEAEAGE
jgi:DNA repair exonuclease SbcCD nuclease subunit